MLVAYNESRQLQTLYRLSRNEATKLKLSKWYCPQCNEQLLLKVGQIISPHFSHRKGAICTSQFSEGETLEHLETKIKLYELFLRNQLPVQLEPTMHSLNRRPDLLVTRNKPIAIEYQWSIISSEEIIQRTQDFKNSHYEVQWIVRPMKHQPFPNATHIQRLSFTQFYKTILQLNETSKIIAYDPYHSEFISYEYCLQLSSNHFLTHITKIPYQSQTVPFQQIRVDLSHLAQQYTDQWLQDRMKRLVQNFRFNRQGIQNPILGMSYRLGIPSIELPNWIGLPLTTFQLEIDPLLLQLTYVTHCFTTGQNLFADSTLILYTSDEQLILALSLYIQVLKKIYVQPPCLKDELSFEQLSIIIYEQLLQKS